MDVVSPNEKLDRVLNIIATEQSLNGVFRFDAVLPIVQSQNPQFINDDKELVQVLLKLEKDGFLKFILTHADGKVYPDNTFRLLFDGKFFNQNGGYTQKSISEESESDRLKALEISAEKQGEALNNLTAWIAVAAVISSVYSVFLIYDWLYDHCVFLYPC